jgi:hypothetical protein
MDSDRHDERAMTFVRAEIDGRPCDSLQLGARHGIASDLLGFASSRSCSYFMVASNAARYRG